MNYYEHHIGDYAEATAHLSILEDGVYSRLIRKIYATERSLPCNKVLVYRLIGARTREEKRAVDSVLDEFFVLEEDGYHNPRCALELQRFQGKRASAQKSANARWQASERNANASETHVPKGTNGHANALPTQCEGNALQSPVSNHQSPVTSKNEDGGREKLRAARSPPGTRLPEDFDLTEDRRAYAQERGVEPAATFEAFTAFWRSKAKDNTKLDWDLTWKSWVLRDAKDRKQRQEPRKTRFDQIMEQRRANQG